MVQVNKKTKKNEILSKEKTRKNKNKTREKRQT